MSITPPSLTWQHQSGTPFVTINGTDKGPDNHNGGWQLYNFGVDKDPQICQGGHDNDHHDVYSIWAHFGVRDALFRIARVGFALTVTGFAQ